jgi:hypothetical protein
VAGMLYTFFVEIIDELLKNNNSKNNVQLSKQRIISCSKTLFLYPVTEYEILQVSKSLKGKLSAGLDEISEYLVKQCIEHIKKPLVHIYNALISSGIFPDRLKTAKVILLHKKGDSHDVKVTHL